MNEPKVEGTLEEIINKVYAGIPNEKFPKTLTNNIIDSKDGEAIEYYIGTKEFDIKEILVSEPVMVNEAYSVVLLRLEDIKEADKAVKKIKLSANPKKWIYLEASSVVVANKSDLVILIMSNETLAAMLEANFNKL